MSERLPKDPRPYITDAYADPENPWGEQPKKIVKAVRKTARTVRRYGPLGIAALGGAALTALGSFLLGRRKKGSPES